MIVDEFKSTEAPTPASPVLVAQDPWEDWQPQWQKKRKQPASVHDQQEKHSPTQAAALPGNGRSAAYTSQKAAPQRRILDARLWDALTPAQQNAAQQIAHDYEIMSRGLGYSNSDWTRVRGSGNAGAMHGMAVSSYVEWAQQCLRDKISHAMAIDIIVFGHSCRAVDRDRRVRAGTARQNLVDALTLYCRLKGWR